MKRVFIALLILLTAVGSVYANKMTSPPRVNEGVVVYYDFSETSGTVIHDRTNVFPRLDLDITDSNAVQFLNPGLRVTAPTVLLTSVERTKLDQSKFFTNGITIEVWVKPLNNTQGGPARIVTFSLDSGYRNFTLGQEKDTYHQRFRTSATNTNGSDIRVETPLGTIAASPELQHVVYTRAADGTAKIYVNNVQVASNTITGDGSVWDNTYKFGLFNEVSYPTDDRTWLGDIYIAAIYDRVLSDSDIATNYNAGHDAKMAYVSVAWDANTEPNLKGYRIHYGKSTRFQLSHITDHQTKYDSLTSKYCGTNQDCINSWNWYCICKTWDTSEDKPVCSEQEPDDITTDFYCDRDYFTYDYVLDVKNVTQFTIYNLDPTIRYYFSASAYDDQFDPNGKIIIHESKYSTELYNTSLETILNLRFQ